MLTRKAATELIRTDKVSEYSHDSFVANLAQVEAVIDVIYDSFEQRLCDNCTFDYCGCSIQDTILEVDPEATFTTFGCNGFAPKPCK